MTLRVAFGIDPGLSGAVWPLIDGEPGPFLDMPTRKVGDWGEVDAAALVAWLRQVREAHPGAHFTACVEKVGAMPTDGATSAFRFGEGTGRIVGVLESLAIPYSRAIPAVWKRHYGLLGQGKDAGRELAIRLFPRAAGDLKRKKDNGRADALLLARWHESTQGWARAA
ncbi:hypothetical protein A7A76_07730 [Lysobacter enzymogenes]|uniref:hypothetical protein n=1 Tax=Lysobacter enzymogenes TaxID=69 RepID=UPI0019CF828D|nr:hypothetical protein [Lysobacter enzymogenes]MBN7138983.1 hypothetical protein [Lysobacter enzymogenes]